MPLWLLNPQPHEIIIDAGCGVGWLTLILSKKCRKVIAVDFSPKCIALLKQRLQQKNITNVECHVVDLTEPKSLSRFNKVDKVLCVQVLQHIPTDEKRKIATENIYDVLKPKGSFVVTLHSIMPFLWRGKKTREEISRYYDTNFKIFNKNFYPNEIPEMFSKFDNICVGGLLNFWFIRPRKYLYKLDMLFSRLFLSKFTGYYLIIKGYKQKQIN